MRTPAANRMGRLYVKEKLLKKKEIYAEQKV
jgi:hypothetical protein